jgi:hypothetical protein
MPIIASRPAICHRLSPRKLVRGVGAVALLVTGAACSADGGMFAPSERLTPAVQATMDSLMLDEWAAEARYVQVLQAFGNVSPFTTLRTTNSRRTTALQRVYLQYGVFPPVNPYRPAALGALSAASEDGGAAYHSRERACELSVAIERETVSRYDRLLALDPPSTVVRMAEKNRALSVETDIPAAERCR